MKTSNPRLLAAAILMSPEQYGTVLQAGLQRMAKESARDADYYNRRVERKEKMLAPKAILHSGLSGLIGAGADIVDSGGVSRRTLPLALGGAAIGAGASLGFGALGVELAKRKRDRFLDKASEGTAAEAMRAVADPYNMSARRTVGDRRYALKTTGQNHPRAHEVNALRPTYARLVSDDAGVRRQAVDELEEYHDLLDEVRTFRPSGTVTETRPRTADEIQRAKTDRFKSNRTVNQIGGGILGAGLGGTLGSVLGARGALGGLALGGLGGVGLGRVLTNRNPEVSAETSRQLFKGDPEKALQYFESNYPVGKVSTAILDLRGVRTKQSFLGLGRAGARAVAGAADDVAGAAARKGGIGRFFRRGQGATPKNHQQFFASGPLKVDATKPMAGPVFDAPTGRGTRAAARDARSKAREFAQSAGGANLPAAAAAPTATATKARGVQRQAASQGSGAAAASAAPKSNVTPSSAVPSQASNQTQRRTPPSTANKSQQLPNWLFPAGVGVGGLGLGYGLAASKESAVADALRQKHSFLGGAVRGFGALAGRGAKALKGVATGLKANRMQGTPMQMMMRRNAFQASNAGRRLLGFTRDNPGAVLAAGGATMGAGALLGRATAPRQPQYA